MAGQMTTQAETIMQAGVDKLFEVAATPLGGELTVGIIVFIFLIIVLVIKLMED